jgi:hypothetical protein
VWRACQVFFLHGRPQFFVVDGLACAFHGATAVSRAGGRVFSPGIDRYPTPTRSPGLTGTRFWPCRLPWRPPLFCGFAINGQPARLDRITPLLGLEGCGRPTAKFAVTRNSALRNTPPRSGTKTCTKTPTTFLSR